MESCGLTVSLRDKLKSVLYHLYERRLLKKLDRSALPQHIAVIHDGHRRYAKKAGLPDYTASYRVGMDKVREFFGWVEELEIPTVTCWLLSHENLQRPPEELEPYYDVLIELFASLPEDLHGATTVQCIGSLDLLPDRLVDAAHALEAACPSGERRITIALCYGGRQEIVDATKDLIRMLAADGVPADQIADRVDADMLADHMYVSDVPDPDLVIRTSGESRLSGFLLWQAAYAEFLFVDVYWPAFRRIDLLRSMRDFAGRTRRFGK